MTVKNAATGQPLNLLIAPFGRPVHPADVRHFMARFGAAKIWSETAVQQLIRAAAAAERLLAEHPEQATQLFEDPAGAVEAMRRSGRLADPVDDLLDALESLRSQDHEISRARTRVRAALRQSSIRFGARPSLRSSSQYGTRAGVHDALTSNNAKSDKRKR